jgi:glycerol-3-phosphate acyltransferase PlsY
MITILIVLVIAYALGCLNPSYYLTRYLTGEDIRSLGSGTAGSRNSARLFGKKTALAIFVFDASKAALAIFLITLWKNSLFSSASVAEGQTVELFALLACIAGHIWPVQLGCRGGKGLASLLGGLFFIDMRFFFIGCLIFGLLWLFMQRSELSVYVSLACLPFLFTALYWQSNLEILLPALVLGLNVTLVLIAHRRNIAKFFQSKTT